VRSGEWHTELHLAPGEERRVTVPLFTDAAGTLVTLSASDGFVPADVDRTSRDRRFLGVWVRVD
jgi:hypothetical protein